MNIQLISKANGYGLSKDVQVLREALSGHSVEFTDWQSPRRLGRHHYDYNIFLELLSPAFFGQARYNYYVPNAEWTNPAWVRHFAGIDLMLAKTRDCERIMKSYRPTKYIGFTSPDIHSPIPKRNVVLHLEGKSITKGTQQVREAARELPDIEFIFHKGSPEETIRLQNECQIHCQPSLYEGFGHVLNEARCCGAVLITTGAEPMTDLAGEDYAYGVAHAWEGRMALATIKTPDIASLVQAIQHAHQRTDKAALGQKARQAYLADREAFHNELQQLFP